MDSRLIFLHFSEGFTRECSRKSVAGVNGYPQYGRELPDRAEACLCKAMCLRCREKAHDTDWKAVPKPTQVGGYKDTKARGRNLVKELGNMAP